MQVESAEQEVLGALAGWLREGKHAWLCTIVEISGSSPRPLGSIMACAADGRVCGSLSGGCVEEDLIERLRAGELASAHPMLRTYGLSAEENERLGLPCGGRLGVVAEPCAAATHLAHIEQLLAGLAARRCVRRELVLGTGACRADVVDAVEPLAFAGGVLRHTLGPRFRLLLVGAGQVAQCVATLATMLDYRVVVCDPRAEQIAAWRGPAVELVRRFPDDFLREAGVDRHTAIVTLTHDPRIDDMALMEALNLDAFYVGALGSERTSAKRRERLRELDVAAEHIARLHAPVGLSIGSKRPMEVAIAILAQLIALRRAEPGA
jgi:xanthine dehydrogenase accessory factor